MQKLRAWLPGQHASANGNNAKNAQRHSVSLEPEIGFQITIETTTVSNATHTPSTAVNGHGEGSSTAQATNYTKTTIPELNVHLIAARHLPALFGFKVVQGYLIKVKLFPGSKRLDSSIQTNSWPKFNENFRFPLVPDLKPSLKHSARRGSKPASEFTPEELFAGQFVVFTVYALLELPPASMNRFNKTYRSLRDKSSNLVQKVVESSSGKCKDDKENNTDNDNANASAKSNGTQKVKRKPSDANPRDPIPLLTISESRRNIGSVTCYLEPKIFQRNPRTGFYTTEEMWLPIKDITTTVVKDQKNNLANSPKGVVELALELRDLSAAEPDCADPVATMQTKASSEANGSANGARNPQWNRMTTEVKRKMGFGSSAKLPQHSLMLRVTTARMRCNNKVKDELESTAGSVYVKTTVFEHGIYIDAWKSGNFYPSLSTKWDVGGDAATLLIPLQSADQLENVLIRTTLATKTKMGKKLVLGTVLVGCRASGSGVEHMQALRQAPLNERIVMWHSYQ